MTNTSGKKAGRHFFFFSIVLAVVVLDQLTKFWARSSPSVDLSILKLSFVANTGAAFGLFKNSSLFLAVFGLAVVGLLVYLYPRVPGDKFQLLSFALIFGGTVGNLIDRFFFGFVTDFIDFGFWPVFNIADSALTVGVIILILCLSRK